MKKLSMILFLMGSIQLSAQDTTRLSVLFFGDIMQHDSQISDAYNPSAKQYDYKPCFQFIKPYIQSADLAIGNLELTLAGPPYKGYPQFSAPDELLTALKDMGADVLVTANNHCVDTGKKGLERTIEMLDSLDIPHTGTFADDVSRMNDHPLLIHKNGFTLALLNYTFSTNGLPVTAPNIVNRLDTVSMRADIQKAKSLNPDLIIVFTHWGVEYESLPRKSQKDITEFCFRSGVHLVIGAHPHVLQPMEWRKEKDQLVAYSLGNFVSGQRKRYTDGGAMIRVDLEKIAHNDSTSATIISNASYLLEWVYRTADAEKNYYILPVSRFEKDTTGFIRDAASREAFRAFTDDSRSLYKKYNLNVSENLEIPPDTLNVYKVLLWTKTAVQPGSFTKSVPYGIEKEERADGSVAYYSGCFLQKSQAEKYQAKLNGEFQVMGTQIAEFVNGVRKE